MKVTDSRSPSVRLEATGPFIRPSAPRVALDSRPLAFLGGPLIQSRNDATVSRLWTQRIKASTPRYARRRRRALHERQWRPWRSTTPWTANRGLAKFALFSLSGVRLRRLSSLYASTREPGCWASSVSTMRSWSLLRPLPSDRRLLSASVSLRPEYSCPNPNVMLTEAFFARIRNQVRAGTTHLASAQGILHSLHEGKLNQMDVRGVSLLT